MENKEILNMTCPPRQEYNLTNHEQQQILINKISEINQEFLQNIYQFEQTIQHNLLYKDNLIKHIKYDIINYYEKNKEISNIDSNILKNYINYNIENILINKYNKYFIIKKINKFLLYNYDKIFFNIKKIDKCLYFMILNALKLNHYEIKKHTNIFNILTNNKKIFYLFLFVIIFILVVLILYYSTNTNTNTKIQYKSDIIYPEEVISYRTFITDNDIIIDLKYKIQCKYNEYNKTISIYSDIVFPLITQINNTNNYEITFMNKDNNISKLKLIPQTLSKQSEYTIILNRIKEYINKQNNNLIIPDTFNIYFYDNNIALKNSFVIKL